MDVEGKHEECQRSVKEGEEEVLVGGFEQKHQVGGQACRQGGACAHPHQLACGEHFSNLRVNRWKKVRKIALGFYF